MKRILISLVILVTEIILTACDPSSYYYCYDELANDVSAIELINYDNDDAKTLFENRDKVLSFDFNKMDVIETLSEEQLDDFLQNFSEIRFLMYWRHSDSPQGTSIRIIYKNGDFEIVSYKVLYAGKFGAEGNVVTFIGGLEGNVEFINLINRFFSIRIE